VLPTNYGEPGIIISFGILKAVRVRQVVPAKPC